MLKLSFTGDLNLSGIFYEKVKNNDEIFSDYILNIFQDSNYTIANLETCVTDKPNNIRKDIRIVSPTNSISYLKNRKINTFNLANNHTFDCGYDGFNDTKNSIIENNLQYNGAGSNISEAAKIVYLADDDIKVAIISVSTREGMIAKKNSPGVFCIDNNFALLRKRVNEASVKADWIIVNYHGGEEYSFYPSPSKRRLLKKISAIDKVNIVISHHSHTFQGIEKTDAGKIIFYSLGNFIFDFYSHKFYKNTHKAALIQFNFTKENFDYSLFPTEIDIEIGQLKKGNDDFISKELKEISNFNNYNKKWIKDSYRLIFEKNNVIQTTETKNSENSLKNISPVLLVFNFKFYKRILSILLNENERPIYIGALIYKILNKIGII